MTQARARKELLVWLFAWAWALGLQAQTPAAVSSFAGNAQHTAIYQQHAQNLNGVHWSITVDLNNSGALAHHGAPLVSAANTVFVPVKTANDSFQVSALNGSTGTSIYTLTTDYILPSHKRIPGYSPALATSSSRTRLYYPGAGGTIYYIDNPDAAPLGKPVQQAFYGLADYRANPTAFNSTLFINTPITTDNNGNVFFGFRTQGVAPPPLNSTQSGFARIDAQGNSTYVLAGTAADDSTIGRDSHNSAPTLSNDGSTLYVVVKASYTDSYGYLLGLDSTTLVTKYKVLLRDPRNGKFATILDDSTASPMVAPDDDLYVGVLGNPDNGSRAFTLHFSGDLAAEKAPGASGWDSTPGVVPATIVPTYTGTSSYLVFSNYNNYTKTAGDGDGVNRIALLDPNATQVDPDPSANELVEMREVLSVVGVTPDADGVPGGFHDALSEWSMSTPAVNPSTSSIFVSSRDGHLYRWDLSTDSLSQAIRLGSSNESQIPTVVGPDGTIYTMSGASLFALGNLAGVDVSLTSTVPDLRSVVPGQSLTFAAAITNTGASGLIPTGTVTFEDISFQGTTPVTTALATNVPLDATGHASITASLAAGSHVIQGRYNGDRNFSWGSSSMVEMVHGDKPATTLTSLVNPSDVSQAVTFKATVVATPSGRGLPTGMVTFEEGRNVLAQIPLNEGSASFTTSALGPGAHTLTAVYGSDGLFASSSGTLTHRVNDPNLSGTGSSPRVPTQNTPLTIAKHSTSSGLLSGIADNASNPENLTTEGTADWIHWGETAVNRKATGGSQLSTYTIVGSGPIWYYANDLRPLSWTDGSPTTVGSGLLDGVYLPYAGNGFSFTAPADATVRTLVVHVGGYFSVGKLTAHLSDSSAADFVDTTPAFTFLYDRNYTLTYSAASAGQTLTVTWVETTDLGAGNVNLNAAALSVFAGAITPTAGNPQSTTVGTAFATALQVKVTDVNNNPVSGATVTFTTPVAGATAFYTGGSTAVTNSSGLASLAPLTANDTAGSYYVIASVSGIPTTASFNLTNAPGPPVSITATGGTPESAVVNTAFTTALQAIVKDGFSNPISGATVTFTAPASGPSVTFSGSITTAVTNAAGVVFAPALTANSQTGGYVVTASVAPSVPSASFSLTNTAGGNGSLAGSANSSSAAINLTAVGTSDWIHWGDTFLNRKATGGSQISQWSYAFTQVGGTVTPAAVKAHNMGVENANGDPRVMSWTDGSPTATTSNDGNGLYIDFGTYVSSGRSGFTFTAPADGNVRTLTVYVGAAAGTGGILTAHLSDASAPDFVDIVAAGSSAFDRNYALTYSAGSASQTLVVTWAMSTGPGLVTLNAAALSIATSSITATGGTPQSTVVGTAFATPLQVTVTGPNGSPLNGATVTFTAPTSGASAASGGLTTLYATTNTSGIAATPTLTANNTAGTFTVTASVGGSTANFSLTNTAAAPFAVAATSGTPQSAALDTPFAALQATVTDVHNNPVAGVNVTFTAPASGASGLFTTGATAQAVTNTSGVATAPTLTANGQTGSFTVTASVSGVTNPANFNLTNKVSGALTGSGNSNATLVNLTAEGPADWVHWGETPLNRKAGVTAQISTYTIVGTGAVLPYGNDPRPISWTDGTPTASSASNTNGLYISSTGNGFAITAPADTSSRSLTVYVGGWFSGGTLTAHLSDGSAPDFVDTTTSASGQYDRNYTLVYSALSSGQTLTVKWVVSSGSGNVTLNGAALASASPSITATGGTPQSTPVSTAFPTALQVTVRDPSNNPMSGVTVTFTAPSSGSSVGFSGGATTTAVTGANGVASVLTLTANSAPGTYNVIASISGVPTTATFTLTNTDVASSVTTTAGTPQSTTVNTAFVTPLQVLVKDVSGNPMSGVTVTFAAPTTGASATFSPGTAVTNSSGVAAAPTLTANAQTGTYIVTASVSGVGTSANFSLTNLAQVPASITPTVGTPQSATVNTAFGTALQATVKDASNNPISGVTVTFAAPASGASASFTGPATAVTNTSGVAISSSLTANGIPGPYIVTATVSGVTTPANFSLTNIASVGGIGSLAGSGTSVSTAVNLTTEGAADWVHWGDSALNRKSGVTAQISTYKVVGGGAVLTYNNDPRPMSWTDGTPTASISNNTNGVYVTAIGNGFSITAPAGTAAQTLTVHVGGWNSGGTLTASLSDNSAANFVGTTTTASGSYDGNYTLTYRAGTAGQTLTVTWVMTSGGVNGNVTLNGAALAGASITATAGTPQSTTVNTAFGTALQATVKDGSNNPISGVTVTFAVPASGASASFAGAATATTNANGVAIGPALTANGTTGTYTVTATATGASPASFSLTNLAQVPASITATVGTPQSTTINTTFGTALQATVLSASSAPVSGVTVTFAVPTSGASASFTGPSTAVTNTSGVAISSSLTANGIAGAYIVTATVSGVAPTNFSLTNVAAVVGTGLLSGSGTSANTAVNLTTEGTVDWVHWGDSALNRKSGVTAQISNYTIVGTGPVPTYNNDPRPMSWTDGSPIASNSSDTNGVYISATGNGFSITVPAGTAAQILTVHVGGWNSSGTLTAHLSDGSATNYVDTTTSSNTQYDRNYALTYNAASAGQTLTVTWVMTSGSGTGNVTLNGAALSP
jgi:hypothetical protein